MKTKRTKQNRKINRKTKQTRNKRIKYGAGDFRRRTEFSADDSNEAMRPLTTADFKQGRLMHTDSLTANVAVLNIHEKFLELIKRKNIQEDQTENIIKATGECMLETLRNHLQIGNCIRIGPNTPNNSRYRMGANNIVCIVQGDFTGKPLFALRVCMNRFPIDYISKTYLEELKIFAELSREITPEVYYGGLCLTNYEYSASAPSDSEPQYHFYSLTEAFDRELFELYANEIMSEDRGQRILDITRDTINDLIDKFSEHGMNCDCRATNFVVNSSKNGEDQVIVTKMRMIDIDQTYFLSIKILKKLFQTDYIVQYVDGDVETFAKTFAKFAMKYLFWLEIYLAGFSIAHEYLMELFHHMESNPHYKILFLFLFLNTRACYKGIHGIYKLTRSEENVPFLFGDAFFIIQRIIRNKIHLDAESSKKIIEEFHSILFPAKSLDEHESKSVDEPESVFAKISESKSVEDLSESKSKSPDSKRTRRTNSI